MVLGISQNLIQAALVNYQYVFVPRNIYRVDGYQADILGRFSDDPDDDGHTITMTRNRLIAAKNTDPQVRLWSTMQTCSGILQDDEFPCRAPGTQYTLGNLANVKDAFWSQLPIGFSTGLLRQFAPTINSTTSLNSLTSEEFELSCLNKNDSLYLSYHGQDPNVEFNFEVCMPGNMTQSPWKAIRTRQEFREELLLRASLSGSGRETFKSGIHVRNISVSTTAAYFQLPNYDNYQSILPRLDSDADPTELCGKLPDCAIQTMGTKKYSRMVVANDTNSGTKNVTKNPHKGPLLTIALALFGPGSFFNNTRKDYGVDELGQAQCSRVLPMTHLFRQADGRRIGSTDIDPCIKKTKEDRTVSLQAQYIWSFLTDSVDDQARITNAFDAAAFLTHDVVMTGSLSKSDWKISYDLGDSNYIIPDIEHYPRRIISAHLAVYLACLVALAMYSAVIPRWASELDSLVMMQIGASMAAELPFLLTPEAEDVEVLDSADGWIGEETGGNGTEDDEGSSGGGTTANISALKLGGSTPLKGGRRYRSYTHKDDCWYDWLPFYHTYSGGHMQSAGTKE
ncbi:hypothetical protein JDV02_010380 [Purpureocillium takamizusanense]|uniref:Uncharacterized protein n=1 Tax=Purpureocillium takamizusanense TaxID=2060973 RepID=A0A9Q8VHC4_9HYPO|nr:uncharacterized protein JDV02_010380 [Purpureocillium takamizusanense]UNI24647.1 hypothetical protein JDV02_010380 [Purpureocillium takamizusanense]